MPIINTQRRLAQAGRIRAGETTTTQSGKKVPRKLTKWRLTSASKRNLDAVAAMYGGRVGQWKDAPNEGQWELYTEADELVVVVLPERLGFSQWMELWAGGRCQRRCDGVQLDAMFGGGPCLCDPDVPECKPESRLSVLLAGLPGVGLWRLDTGGRYAQAELAGAMEMAEMLVELRGLTVLPGTLRLDQRSVKRPDPNDEERTITFRFAVPVLDFNVDMHEIAEGNVVALPRPAEAPESNGLTAQLEASLEVVEEERRAGTKAVTPIPVTQYRSPRQQILDALGGEAPPKRRGAAPQLAPTGVRARSAAEAAEEAAESTELTGRQAPTSAEREDRVEQAPPGWSPPPKDAAPPPADPETGEVIEGIPISDAQVRKMQTMFTKSGMLPAGGDRTKVRDFKLHYCSGIIGRKLSSSKDMTVDEASQVIEALTIVVEDL